MSADLIRYDNGDASLAFTGPREGIWHRQGQEMPIGVSVEEAMRIAGLTGWDVTWYPLTYLDPYGNRLDAPNTFVPFRAETRDGIRRWVPIGESIQNPNRPNLVSGIYAGWTPDEFGVFAEGLLGVLRDAGGYPSTCGALGNYAKLFIAFDLSPVIVAGDEVRPYLSMITDLVGEGSTKIANGDVRWVCKNTVDYGLSTAKSTVSIRHTKNMFAQLEAAREALGVHQLYARVMHEQLEKFALESFGTDEVVKLVEEVWKPEVSADVELTSRQETNLERAVEEVVYLSRFAPTVTNHRGTKLAAFNAVTEYNEWFAPRLSKDPVKRSWSVLEGVAGQRNKKTYDYLVGV
jgi:phage/plasmid-like protein (TIGR03299 family)